MTANATDGRHTCAFRTRPRERADLHARFLAAGLSAGDRVALVHPGVDHSALFDMVTRYGVDAQRASRSGQLMTLYASARYGRGASRMDSEAVVAEYAQLSDATKREGYPALRVSAEIHDMLGFDGFDELIAYERRISKLASAEGIIALCQYEGEGFASDHRAAICDAHHAPGRTGPQAPWLKITPDGGGLFELSGELDRHSAQMVKRVIRGARPKPISLDVTGLSFVDVGGWRVLADGGVKVVGRSEALDRVDQLIAEAGAPRF